MTNLVDEFFKRNLTEAEAQVLDGILEKSQEDALRFGKRMEQEYLAMGLPVPQVPKHFGPPSAPGGSLSLLKAALLVAAVAGTAVLTWKLWPKPVLKITESPHPMEKPAVPATLQRPQAKLPPPPVELPRRLTGSPAEGNRLSVVVELGKPAPVQVAILDQKDQMVRSLYQGSLKAGKWSIRWDGLLSDGSKAPAGNYRIRVKSGPTEMFKSVSIESIK